MIELKSRQVIVISMLVIITQSGFAQEDILKLPRAEWQVTADLDFKLACHRAKDDLCRAIISTAQSQTANLASLLLADVQNLLQLANDDLPKSLPRHEASSRYLESRKAAVIAWIKTYKSKGREIPKSILDRERTFVAQQTKLLMDISTEANSNNAEISPDQVTSTTTNTSSQEDTSEAKDNSSASEVKSDSRVVEVTTKSIQLLIEECYTQYSSPVVGETTAERQLAAATRQHSLQAIVDKQPMWFLTFPIMDVRLGSESLILTLDEPLELATVKQRAAGRFVVDHQFKKLVTNAPAIVRKWKTIKKGDGLRVKLEPKLQTKQVSDEKTLFYVYKQSQLSNLKNAAYSLGSSSELGEFICTFEIRKLADTQIVKLLQKPVDDRK